MRREGITFNPEETIKPGFDPEATVKPSNSPEVKRMTMEDRVALEAFTLADSFDLIMRKEWPEDIKNKFDQAIKDLKAIGAVFENKQITPQTLRDIDQIRKEIIDVSFELRKPGDAEDKTNKDVKNLIEPLDNFFLVACSEQVVNKGDTVWIGPNKGQVASLPNADGQVRVKWEDERDDWVPQHQLLNEQEKAVKVAAQKAA